MHASDRGLLVGANGTGKSTLAAYVLTKFREDYPDARIAVFDTKPRWRAVRQVDGTGTRWLYRALAKGDTIPGAVSVQRMTDWSLAWDRDANPSQTVIFQRFDGTQLDNVRFQVAALEKLFKTQRASRPTLAYLDEGMDFFSVTAGAKGGSDIVQRCYRAGRERGLATLAGVQRPTGINAQMKSELNWCAFFRINLAADIKTMYDIGWPQNAPPPGYDDPKGTFRLWREGSREAPRYRLQVKG